MSIFHNNNDNISIYSRSFISIAGPFSNNNENIIYICYFFCAVEPTHTLGPDDNATFSVARLFGWCCPIVCAIAVGIAVSHNQPLDQARCDGELERKGKGKLAASNISIWRHARRLHLIHTQYGMNNFWKETFAWLKTKRWREKIEQNTRSIMGRYGWDGVTVTEPHTHTHVHRKPSVFVYSAFNDGQKRARTHNAKHTNNESNLLKID